MKKKTRVIVVFILNFLWPGLGFYYSGTLRNLKWLCLFGLALISVFLLLVTVGIAILIPRPLINYHFTASDLPIPLAIAFISGILGTVVEHKMKE